MSAFDTLLPVLVHLFVVVDPIGLVPMFLALSAGSDAPHRRRMAILACLVGAIVLFTFALIGERLLSLLGISLAAFRLAGGLMLFMIAIEMVFEKRTQRRERQVDTLDKSEHEQHQADEVFTQPDIAVFPLGIPLIAGPGAIASVMLLGGEPGDWQATTMVLSGVTLILLLTLALFLVATRIAHILPAALINVISRLLGILLAALSVQFVIDAIQQAFPSIAA